MMREPEADENMPGLGHSDDEEEVDRAERRRRSRSTSPAAQPEGNEDKASTSARPLLRNPSSPRCWRR